MLKLTKFKKKFQWKNPVDCDIWKQSKYCSDKHLLRKYCIQRWQNAHVPFNGTCCMMSSLQLWTGDYIFDPFVTSPWLNCTVILTDFEWKAHSLYNHSYSPWHAVSTKWSGFKKNPRGEVSYFEMPHISNHTEKRSSTTIMHRMYFSAAHDSVYSQQTDWQN